jgi:L-ribulose-5-phosphate 3-epimerase
MYRQLKLYVMSIILIVLCFRYLAFAQESQKTEYPEAAYTKTINQRADKIVTTLGITDSDKAKRVRDIIAGQYRSLRDIHDGRDAQIKAAREKAGNDKKAAEASEKDIREKAQSRQDQLHKEYLKKLSVELSPEQVDKVKDGMTYGVLQVTYDQYLAMLPDLTGEQKKQIMAFLIEAREIAMDGGTSEEKHQWFRKYKGKINNYLSAAGYDLKKAEESLRRRPKAASSQIQPKQRYKIAVCDWMILKRQKLGAFERTKEIGADGVEVDMGSLGDRESFDNALADPAVRKQFLDKTKELDLEICSLAMSAFYAQSFAERPTVPRMMQDCIDTMKLMNVKVAFLPLGVRSDPNGHPELRSAVVERLKAAGAQAEKAGVIIGIETELPAEDQIKLLDDIGSPAIRIYYNFSNALQNGRDLYKELRTLGKDRICQIHCTDQDGVWLQDDPKIDVPKVKQTLDEMGWSGWLVIERSRSAKNSRDVVWNFGANTKYLKSIFQAEQQ